MIFRAVYSAGGLTIVTSLSWFLIFLNGRLGKKKILIFFLSIIIFIVPFIDGLIIKEIIFENQSFIFKTGPIFEIYSVFLFIIIIYLFYKIVHEYKKSVGLRKQQIGYILAGLFIYTSTTVLLGLVLPSLKITPVVPFDAQSSFFWVALTAYAIIKHRFLDIRLIVLRTITYSLVVLIISAAVVSLSLLLPEYLSVNTETKFVIAIATSIFIVLIVEPLKRWIGKLTDQVFFKARIDYTKLLADLSEVINREIDLDVLLSSLAHKLEKELKIKNASIYIAGVAGGAFFKRKGRVNKEGQKIEEEQMAYDETDQEELASRLAHNNPLIEYINQERMVIVLEGLERKIEDTQDEQERKKLEASKSELDKLDAAVVAPVLVGNNLNGVMVLGPKLSGDPFGSEDINLLDLIGPQLASALDKSRLYDEIKQFSERLKKEVAMATEDLRNVNVQMQERNRFLSALQSITNLITRTLDYKKVTQAIADSIYHELGYVGGILLFLHENRHKIFPDAVTQSPLTKQLINLLPKPLTEYWGDFRKDDTRSIRAIKKGEVQIGKKLSDFLSPPVPAEICEVIQNKGGVKAIIAVPVYSETEVVGVIDFLLPRDPGTMRSTDLSIMKAVANQAGIVYRNIDLYRKLQQSNLELAEANKYLQQLDQAKSEFVSIASHQLRTPMSGIMGYLSMMLDGDFGKVPAKHRVVLANLLQASQRMIQMINLFLDVSKIESGKLILEPKPNHIEDTIIRDIEVLKKIADNKGLTLKFVSPKKPLPMVMLDERFFDVLSNLIDNSIKYTDDGGVTVKAEADGKYVTVSVHDTGRGINPEEVKGLFKKFVRGSGMAQVNPDGSGLGLYVAKRITEAHGGKIWMESKGLGKGSTFYVQLPIANVNKS